MGLAILLILAVIAWGVHITVKLGGISGQLKELGQNLDRLRAQITAGQDDSALLKSGDQLDAPTDGQAGTENVSWESPTPAASIPPPVQTYQPAAKSAAAEIRYGAKSYPGAAAVSTDPFAFPAGPEASPDVRPDAPSTPAAVRKVMQGTGVIAENTVPTGEPDGRMEIRTEGEAQATDPTRPGFEAGQPLPCASAGPLEGEFLTAERAALNGPGETLAPLAPVGPLAPVDPLSLNGTTSPAQTVPQDEPASAEAGQTEGLAGASFSDELEEDEYFDDFEEDGEIRDGLFDHLYKFVREGNIWVAGGVLMLLLGFAFLLTYMAERGVFSIEMRIASAAATGLAMVGLGLFLRTRRPSYALIMQGGGLGVMYLAVFAAAKLTALFSGPVALVLMTLLILPGVALAVLQGAQVLALFAFLGGFAAPILLSDGSGNYLALFSYYALLNLGLLVITRFKLWRWLNLLGGFCTFVVLGYWCFASYNLTQFLKLEPFLIGFTLIYTLITLISAHKQTFSFKIPADAVLACAIPFVAAFLQWRMAEGIAHGLSLSALAFGAFYLLLAVLVWQRWARVSPPGQDSSMRRLAELYLACGVMLVNLAVPLEFSEEITSAVWSLEGAVLYYMAVRTGSGRIKLVALSLLLVGLAACALDLLSLGEAVRHKLLSTCMTGFGLVLAACLENRERQLSPARAPHSRALLAGGPGLQGLLALCGMAVWFLGLAVESGFNSEQPFNFLLLSSSLSALAFCAAGKKTRLQNALRGGLAAPAGFPVLLADAGPF